MTSGEIRPDDEVLVGYVSSALEMRERGEQPCLRDLCRQHPELVDHVAAALARAPDLPGLAVEATDFDALRGRVLARRYRLEERVGAGAMGVVYRGVDTELGRPVAIKLMRTELFGGAEAEARFGREAEVLAALRHESVVAVFDRGRTTDGLLFLVMELLQGQALAALLAEQAARADAKGEAVHADATAWLTDRLEAGVRVEQSWLRQAVVWTADLAAGLHRAHQAGIFHRDVKPSNVYVGDDGRARLFDFGVAARVAHATLGATRDTALGTPAYMPPEQLAANVAPAPTLDVYGLAATLYHMLTLRPPYQGTASQVIARLQGFDPTPAHRLRRGTPRDLLAILDRGMARRPSERYPSMAEFEADLRAFLAHQPVRARPLTVVDRTWRRLRRSPTARVVAVLASLASVGWLGLQWRAAALADRGRQYRTASAQIPPGLTLERAGNRRLHDADERESVLRILDAAVANAPDPLVSIWKRAAFRFDQGDLRGAVGDATDAASRAPSALTRALAERYRHHADHAIAEAELDLDDLPPPESVDDRYVAAYHGLRAGVSSASNDRAIELLDVPATSESLPAQELLAFAFLYRAETQRRSRQPESQEDAVAGLHRVYELVIGIEAARGYRTAATAQLLGTTLSGQERYAQARDVLCDGVALAPGSAGLWNNLAVVERRLGRFEDALASCARATELRPANLEPYLTRAQVCLDLGDVAAARVAVAAAPVPGGAAGERARARLASIETSIALFHFAQGEADLARSAAATAAIALAACGREATREYRLCLALRDNDEGIFDALLEVWLREPTSWAAIENVARTLPRELSGLQTETLTEALHQLSRSLAPTRRPTARLPESPLQSPTPETK